MEFINTIYISNEYYKLIKKEMYEGFICFVMNESKNIFKGKYQHQTKQSKGESDFYKLNRNGQIIKKLDAKILFSNLMCQYIAKDNIDDFVIELKKYVNEIFDSVTKEKDIDKTILYKEMYDAIANKLDKDEDGVFFIPFPISSKIEGSLVYSIGQDNIECVYNSIKNNYPELVKKRNFYVITFNNYNDIVIYNLSDSTLQKYEFLKIEHIKKYIENR